MQALRKPIVQALIGSGLLLVGLIGGVLLGGTVFAASATRHNSGPTTPTKGPTRYCQVYEQALANDLNVSESALEHANIDALDKTLDQMVKDGQITATERSQIEPLIQQVGAQPCTHLTDKTVSSYLQGDTFLMQEALAAHTQLVNTVATSLGVTPTVLQADLAKGQTISQIAATQKVPLATVNTAYLNEVKALLAQAVSGGVITQEQSEYAYKSVANGVAKGQYPLLSLGDASGK